ncbi:MAG: hypothetical protein BWX80_04185 [Candidatus Hydrogenedentes bacterium ADurb.Bin101]|nr:MAG: hypothetical protein BWX80_04230 [Candidatus Hydrogenedentes bacterium ADurb.Bin101]OQB96490.1 MAG: hypothetical protein BWX80_04185 [Candidatus Hydrogenedentes bacterium ADurb.Bin101]
MDPRYKAVRACSASLPAYTIKSLVQFGATVSFMSPFTVTRVTFNSALRTTT